MRLEIIDNDKTIRVELHTNVGVFEPSEAMKNLKADLFNAVHRYENKANNELDTTTKLIPITERMPDNSFGFVWVKCASRDDLILAYFTDGKFQYAETVGDREGLSVEYHEDVTHWAEIIIPEIKSQPLNANR